MEIKTPLLDVWVLEGFVFGEVVLDDRSPINRITIPRIRKINSKDKPIVSIVLLLCLVVNSIFEHGFPYSDCSEAGTEV